MSLLIKSTDLTDEQKIDLKTKFKLEVTKWDSLPEWKDKCDDYKISSVLFQVFDENSEDPPSGHPFDLLYGSGIIEEVILGKRFSLSIDAFFQVNSSCAEKLYTIAGEWAQLGPDTTLLDVCCGTGTIGITLADKVGKVIGLEIIESAVEDAKKNAELNNIQNAVYVCGKAEETSLPAIREHALSHDIVAIVDPPRAGLHPSVLKVLRNTRAIKRVVYVSCNPKSMMEDVCRLSRAPNKVYKNERFVPIKAVPVDMFPHTNHCEMVMLLER